MRRRRFLLVQSTKSQLPDGYKQVEYLQTDPKGFAYIDTKYIYDVDSLISCEYLVDVKQNSYVVFGIRSTNYKMVIQGQAGGSGSGGSTNMYYSRSASGQAAGYVNAPIFTKYQIWQEPKRLAIKTPGSQQVRYIYTDDNYQNETKCNLFIFTENDHGRRGMVSWSLRIYSLSITKNNELVVNLVPCKDNKNVPCFYDTVRKITLYNSSTSGEFITGNEV